MVKVLGTQLEGDIAERAHLAARSADRRRLRDAVRPGPAAAPGFHAARRHERDTARRHRPRAGHAMSSPAEADPDFTALVDEIFADHAADLPADAPLDAADPALTDRLESLGLARLTAPESPEAAADLARGSGRAACRGPVRHRGPGRGGRPPPRRRGARARQLRGALMRAVQMTGAMDAAVDLTVQHATERMQFGQPPRRLPGRAATHGRTPPPKPPWPEPRPTRRLPKPWPRGSPVMACFSQSRSPAPSAGTLRPSSSATRTRCTARSARPENMYSIA